MVHVAVDLHKRVSQAAMVTAEGELKQHRLPNEPGQVPRFFEQVPRAGPGDEDRPQPNHHSQGGER